MLLELQRMLLELGHGKLLEHGQHRQQGRDKLLGQRGKRLVLGRRL